MVRAAGKTFLGFLVGLSLLGSVRAAIAQSTFGSIIGTAQDQSALPVPGATIVIRSTDENTSQSAVSDATGVFQFLNLKPGGYEIEASLPGFSNVTLRGLHLDARQTLRVSVTLTLAGVAEEVSVSAGAPAINTENGTLADSKTFVQVTQLPVNYRGGTTSPLAAIATVPGVQQDNSGNVSVGGGTPAMVQYSVDGISAVNVRANGALGNLNPSSELIRELKVTAFNNNAEFSQIGDVTITTKSGTNTLHGSLFEYLQTSALDAKAYGFDSKPPKTFNTFGGSVAGPLHLPGLYDGCNRTFFFADVESNRRRTSTPKQLSVPTASMRTGDLSILDGSIVDPLTGSPFAGSRIPEDRINPVSRTLLNLYYPLPNVGGSDTNANLRQLVPTPSDTNGYDVRIDQTFGPHQQIYGRWSAKNLETMVANNLLPNEVNRETNRNLVLSHNWIVSSSVINELRFGTSRYHLGVDFPIAGAAAIRQLGLLGLDISNHPTVNAFPVFDFSDGTGFTPIGRDKTGITESQTTQLSDNLIWVRGRHALKFGGDLRILRYYDLESFGGANDFGALTFSANTFSGNAFADFLLGLPAKTYVARSGPDIDGRARQIGVYGQDTWTAGRLTLNYGLRWQILPPFKERYGNITVFDKETGGVIIPGPSQPTPGFLTSINACPGVNPALPCAPIRSAQEARLGSGLRRTYLGNVQPRLSVAYRLDDRGATVLRGGIGVYTMTQLGQLSFNITDIHVSDLRTDINTIGADGQPRYTLPAVQGPSNPIDIAGTGEFYQNVPIDYRDPQAVQWNATIEQGLRGSMALRVSYAGMHTYRMNVTVDLNQVQPGAAPYDPDRRPYRNWGRILSSENLGWSTYHAMQVEVNRRLHQGLAFQASYTLARNVGTIGGDAPTGFTPEVIYGLAVTDRFNLDANAGNIAATRRHRVLLTGAYVVPRVRLEASTVTLLQSGPYLTPTISPVADQANVNALGRGTMVRPDLVGNPSLARPTPDAWWNINAFAPTPAGAGRVGNAGVGILEGPGTFTIGAGLAREFGVARGVNARVELTFTNILNRINYAPPAADVTTPATFGKTTSVQTAENAGNRTGQLAFRLSF